MKAIVLVGGLGTRLHHITAHTPKPMAVVNGSPFLEYILNHLVKAGVNEIVLAVSYKREIIQQHFGDSYQGVPLQYSIEIDPLGTGGAILKASEYLEGDNFIVLNGDTLFPIDLEKMLEQHIAKGALLSMGVKQVENAERFGRVILDEHNVITGFIEKGKKDSGLINGGVYAVNKKLFASFKNAEIFSFETDLIEKNLSAIQPEAFISEAYFIDIGVPVDYERAQMEVRFDGNSSSRIS